MSYLSLMATVIGGNDAISIHHHVEIVEQRVKISAFAEAERDEIILHVSSPDVVGPAVCAGKDVRVVIFEELVGGQPICTLFTVAEIQVGQNVVLGTRK